MKTIAILSQKGGSGKTTTALHLAVAAEQDGKTAVVIDLDPQGSATMWFEARKAAGHGQAPAVMPTHPAQLEAMLIALADQKVDFAIIDTAPQSDSLGVQAAKVADLVLVTCKPSVMDLRAIQSTLRLADIAGATPHVLLTQVEAQGTRKQEASDTLKRLGVKVLPEATTKRVAYMDALIDGRSATELEPNGKAAEETRAIYQHVSMMTRQKANTKAGRAA